MQRDVCGRVLHISAQRRPSFQRRAVIAVKAVTVGGGKVGGGVPDKQSPRSNADLPLQSWFSTA